MWSPESLGWTTALARHFEPFAAQGLEAGRVAVVHKDFYGVYAPPGELWAEASGRLRHRSTSPADLPVTGDWVVIRTRPAEGRATIHAVLPRRSLFSRKAAGAATEEQAVAANAETAFLVTGLDQDFNLRRIERALVLAARSGAQPVIVLTKADLCADAATRKQEVERTAPAVPVLVVAVLELAAVGVVGERVRPLRRAAHSARSALRDGM